MGFFRLLTYSIDKKWTMATSGLFLLPKECVAVGPKGISTPHVVHRDHNYFTTSFPREYYSCPTLP